jgi:heme exporter protein B
MTQLFTRDLVLAFRSGGGFGLTLAFFLIVVMFVPFGVGPQPEVLARIAPGILWIGALLACLLSLDRIFQLDYEDGTLDVLATSPLPLEGIAAAKAAAHWVTTGVPLTLVAPFLGYLLNLPEGAYIWLVLGLFAGTPALSFLGMFGAALTVGVKRGGLLLSLLVLPLYIPTLIFGAQVVVLSVQGLPAETPLFLLAGMSLLTVAAMPFAAAPALRANLR